MMAKEPSRRYRDAIEFFADVRALETHSDFRLEQARESGYFRNCGRLSRIEADPDDKRRFARPDSQSFRTYTRAGPDDP